MSKSNGDDVPGPTPTGLGKLLGKIHKSHRTERAIADTAKRRRIKAKQDKDKGKDGKK